MSGSQRRKVADEVKYDVAPFASKPGSIGGGEAKGWTCCSVACSLGCYGLCYGLSEESERDCERSFGRVTSVWTYSAGAVRTLGGCSWYRA